MKKLLLILLFTVQIQAATYYIDTASTGSGDGTTTATSGGNAAWAAFSEITGLAAGDFVLLNKGDIWREELRVPTSGSAGSPITFSSYGSGAKPIISAADLITTSGWADQTGNVWRHVIGATEPLQVFFNGDRGVEDATPDANGEWTYTNPNLDIYAESDPDGGYYDSIEVGQRQFCIDDGDKNYITISYLATKHANDGFNGNIRGHYTGAAARSDIIIHDCDISFSYSCGIRFVMTHADASFTGFEIYNNTIHNNGTYAIYVDGVNVNSYIAPTIHNNTTFDNGYIRDVTDGDGISLEDCTNGLIYENYSYNDGGIDHSACIRIGSNTLNLKIYRNRLRSPGAENIWMSGSNIVGVEFYNNLCTGAVNWVGIMLGEGCSDILIYNNTVYEAKQAFSIGEIGQCTNITIKNNIVDNCGIWGNFASANASTYTINYNCWDETKTFDDNGVFKTWEEWQSSGYDTDGLYTDPIFVDAANDNFHLLGNSPALGIGRYPEEFPLGRKRYNRFGGTGLNRTR